MSKHTPNLDQQIADTKATILAFFLRESADTSVHIADIYVYAKAVAKDLVRNHPDVNARLLEAAKDVQDAAIREVWGCGDMKELDRLDDAIAAADKEPS